MEPAQEDYFKKSTTAPVVNKAVVLISVIAILAVVFIAFFPSLKNGFINYDDNVLVTNNIKIKALSAENIKSYFTSFTAYLYHPLVLLTYAVEYHFFKLNPFPYHAANLAFHLGSCLLVFWLVFLLSGRVSVAFITAALFGVHPLRVESVAWVTERKDVLSVFFYLAALVSYLYYAGKKSRGIYCLPAVMQVLSLLSKPTAVTFPVILLLMDYFQGRKLNKQAFIEKMPFFIISIIFGIAALIGHYPAGGASVPSYPFVYRIFFAAYGLAFYLGKTIAPVKLACIYQYPPDTETALPLKFLLAPLAVAALFFAVEYSMKRTKKIFFGAMFFFVTILPVLQLLPVGGGAVPADRYTYISSIGLFYILAEGVYWLYARDPRLKVLISIVMAAAIGIFGSLTWRQCGVWRDSVTLWNDYLKIYENGPQSYQAYHNRGMAYEEKGDFDKAIADYRRVLELNTPDPSRTLSSRGLAYAKQNQLDKAFSDMNEALKYNPKNVEALNFRGNLFNLAGRKDEAVADYSRALELEPENFSASLNRGMIYLGIGDMDRAIADLSRALKTDPGFEEAFIRRGSAYLRKKEFTKAAADFTAALKLNPVSVSAYRGREAAWFMLKEYGKARDDVKKLQKLGNQPDPRFVELLRKYSGGE